MHSREDVYQQLHDYLVDMFEVPAEDIQPDARLMEDLDLDSIDAVDLIVKFQEITGKKIPAMEFRSVRTVDDVVEKIHDLVSS
ncbi:MULTISPECIES: acyl carrier protein [Thalassospira]|jgi:acyl carrier protein|uniref:Acyl carrier protein n=2 Tax=Thalassospira tepidiphila TaxID=393657 RepID=A0A853KYU2_9PROT|nr:MULTISPECIES: acyl carrier protein [Thalassospira]KXJ50499.1 MAG: acyl carrier protein [Thalassospira sp. Nap_22]MBO6578914.1 acyl carrier protein [Thalassospira sp.]MBO6803613.1 acyl carrier protein [Thalassospira sp.]MBO6820275.1 acyl carrier protein [Thalassospira sp.]MBO6889743.1 acyl carrier protein [Thalassospira sp.]